MAKTPKCKHCGALGHYAFQCFYRRKVVAKVKRRIRSFGKQSVEYMIWRDTVAIPYLIETYGYKCASCGKEEHLDVDHIKGRGSHPELKMEVTNVQFLCRRCHRIKTDRIKT